jgi:peptidoglycan/xylan/chitin deacetylase (PgdA/CDA1 family)
MEGSGWSGWSDEEETRPLTSSSLPPAPPHQGRKRRQLLWTASAILVVVGLVSALIATGPLLVGDSSPQFVARLWGAPSHIVAPTPFPTATEVPLTLVANSPQGCVDGQAPVAKSSAIIVSAAGQTPTTPGATPGSTPNATPSIPAAAAHEVALTFDDGPNPAWTPQVLTDLQAAGMHATFFVIGVHAQRFPDLVEQEWQDGMTIGNHTLHHEHLLFAKPAAVRDSLTQSARIIKGITHDPCLWLFRPPYGVLAANSGAANEMRGEGYTIVNWDTQGHDWTRPGVALIVQRVVEHLHAGSIILLHDGAPDTEAQDRSQTVVALPQILAALKARGLVSVTLPQLLRDSGLVSLPSPPPPQVGV